MFPDRGSASHRKKRDDTPITEMVVNSLIATPAKERGVRVGEASM